MNAAKKRAEISACEFNPLLPRITLTDEAFAICDREVEAHDSAFAEQFAFARGDQYKAQGLGSLGACEAASLQI